MPSKKKMWGRKARKSKAAATVSVEEVNTHREPECKHFAVPDHRTKDDILQCKAVFDGLRDKFHSHFRELVTLEGAALSSTVLGKIIDEVKEEYNDTVFSFAKRRELCWANLISLGTGDCLKLLQADESTNIIYSWFWTLLAAMRKALHHCEGGFGIGSVVDWIFLFQSRSNRRENWWDISIETSLANACKSCMKSWKQVPREERIVSGAMSSKKWNTSFGVHVVI